MLIDLHLIHLIISNFVLGKPKSQKEKVARHQGQFPRASQGKAQVQRNNHGRIVEEKF